MALPRRKLLEKLAPTSIGVAAFCLASAGALQAQTPVATPDRTLAAELRVAAGDIARLDEPDLPRAHREGLAARIAGSLGLLPWLLREAGDHDGADRLAEGRKDDLADIARRLDALMARHTLDLAERGAPTASAKVLLEARAIHDAYCAGCHDDTGDGDPEMTLPIRDLFEMARTEPADIFAARLYVGVKGDETIGFRNPLSEAQFLGLWRYYSTD
jgi:hypothetical protein